MPLYFRFWHLRTKYLKVHQSWTGYIKSRKLIGNIFLERLNCVTDGGSSMARVGYWKRQEDLSNSNVFRPHERLFTVQKHKFSTAELRLWWRLLSFYYSTYSRREPAVRFSITHRIRDNCCLANRMLPSIWQIDPCSVNRRISYSLTGAASHTPVVLRQIYIFFERITLKILSSRCRFLALHKPASARPCSVLPLDCVLESTSLHSFRLLDWNPSF